MRSSPLVLAFVILGACGGGAATESSDRPQNAAELICHGTLPDECGITRADCERRANVHLDACTSAGFRAAEISRPNRDQAERAVMLSILCAPHMMYEQRRQEGFECRGNLAEGEVYEICPLCVAEVRAAP